MAELTKIDVFGDDPRTPPIWVSLYCWTHREAHLFAMADVERIVYSLGAAERVAAMVGAEDPTHGRCQAIEPPSCPQEVLRWSLDAELYIEHVDQGVECRKAVSDV